MFKKALPVFVALLAMAFPVTAFANETGESGSSIAYTENESTVSVITAGGTYADIADTGDSYYPLEIRTVSEDGEKLVMKTYEVPSGMNPQRLVEEDIEKNGIPYELRDILKRTVEQDSERKLASKVVTLESKTKDTAEIIKQLAPVIDFNEGGYIGQLQLDTGSIYAEADGYTSYRYPVTEVRKLAGMDRNDTYYIPKSANKNGVQLALNNVQWATMGCGAANNGRLVANNFQAVAEYVGYATGSTATGYTATATYIGEVSRPMEGSVIYTLVYGPKLDAGIGDVTQAQAGLTLNPAGDSKAADAGFAPIITVMIVLLTGAAATVLFLWLRKRTPRPALAGKDKPRTKIYMPRDMQPDLGEEDDDE